VRRATNKTSKLLKLKEWFTVEDAAQILSSATGESVRPRDILRLALDGPLILSIFLVNRAPAKLTTVSEKKESGDARLTSKTDVRLRTLERDRLRFGEIIILPRDVYDLPMLGNDRLYVEQEFQKTAPGLYSDLHDCPTCP
jgi:hypothetical protein